MKWKDFLEKERNKIYFINILNFINKRKKLGFNVYPKNKYIFNAFNLTEFNKVKIIILGQDPYIWENQANGLAFSVNHGIKIPPTLLNIYKEIKRNNNDFIIPNHGYLGSWANQGIMLLNVVLTVERGKPNSHGNIGWEIFTDKVIKILNKNRKKLIFVLWGKKAQKKLTLIDNKNHFILKTSHPSPLSAHYGFNGCKHFSKINTILMKQGKSPIDWRI